MLTIYSWLLQYMQTAKTKSFTTYIQNWDKARSFLGAGAPSFFFLKGTFASGGSWPFGKGKLQII